ncbi:phenylacetic acid degradation operon negative regulatory protein PaaX [Woeseia oceani]|uniref:Phenylacetic acid degradation operon negative regulatory protein PaaX n=1 Tax=Woeseia oceani TaxID=1548547 RepID=A0A193LGU0_9GAMM|nr:phenylacetic acid degradation operon negative regulatory protein PaaX [Woeseia oceani]ANO51727.1 phenylacetic acid degradation operon negative regulatory protein PaaX [Woeseia oceani]
MTNRRSHRTDFTLACKRLVRRFEQQKPIRASSLVISVFGDSIAVHGGSVWLGNLIQALQRFGVNQRLVRTSVFRLVKDGWLDSEQLGRRSYYRLTASGRHRFDQASKRIYAEPHQAWPGTWYLVMTGALTTTERDTLRKELGWLGFAPFSTCVFAHPAPDLGAVKECLAAAGCSDRVMLMESRVTNERQQSQLKKQVHAAWSLDAIASRYRKFLKDFQPVYASVCNQKEPLDPELCFQVRTLLIHEYRKIHLRDPLLPDALLPRRWDGAAAYQLCRNLYSTVAAPAEPYLVSEMETADGPLPAADAHFYQRFGGLKADNVHSRS